AGQARLDAEVEDHVADYSLHARAGAEHLLHRAPVLFELVLLPVVQSPGLGFEPGINPVLGVQALVNVPRLIDQVEHYLVLHRFAEFVGVDVATKDFQASRFVFLEQRRAGETNEDGVGQHRLHRPMQLAALALGAVALVYKNKNLAHCLAGLGLQFLDERVEVFYIPPTELVDEGAQQARFGSAELAHQVAAAASAVDSLSRLGEDSLDLFVQLVAIGDDSHAGVGVVLQNPLAQQHHDDALATALGVPDDAALATLDVLLR